MTLEPSIRRVGVAAAITALGVVMMYFLPYPHPGSDVILMTWPVGFISGYLLWPLYERIRYPQWYFRPSPARIFLALGLASVIAVNGLYLQSVVMNDGLNVEGTIVVLLVTAFFLYVKLGNQAQPHS